MILVKLVLLYYALIILRKIYNLPKAVTETQV
jgi:hypothetical protein